MIRSTVGAALALALAACSPSSDSPPASSNPAPSGPNGMGAATLADLRTNVPMKDLMTHVIDFAAWGIWKNQGWWIDINGTEELFPKDDDVELWHAVESHAFTLAETSNLLLLPGRPQDDDKTWVEAAHLLNEAALRAQENALKRNKDALFQAGSDIYEACVMCHSRYIVGNEEPLKPLPNRGPAPLPSSRPSPSAPTGQPSQ
jgi:hypothetical protein